MLMEIKTGRSCLLCGDGLRGRMDKRFCDDVCRNRWHNQSRRAPKMSDRARSIQRQLIKNRAILLTILRERKRCMVQKEKLIRAGFYFEVYSHKTKYSGRVRTYCLDVGYRLRGGGCVEIGVSGEGLGIFQ
jgi:predicted nucleic acid-binding Zn ribbon protein